MTRTEILELAKQAGADFGQLVAEVAALKADLEIAKEAQRCECSADQACRFAKERDALKADAERYRWLLNYGSPHLWHECSYMDSYDGVEAAIDTAIKEKT